MRFSGFQVSKIVRLASALLAFLFRTMRNLSCIKEERAVNSIRSSRDLRFLDWRIQVGSVSDSSQGTTAGGIGFNNYVLHLEGEDDLVLWMSSSGHKDMDRWMERGKKEDCRALLHLLSKSSVCEGFKGMRLFDNENIPPIPTSSSDIPPNCWTLPAITLITLVISLTRSNGDHIQTILMGFSQSLKLMNFVENNLDFRGLLNMRKAAAIVRSSIDLKGKWLDHDLANLDPSTRTTTAVDDLSLANALQIIECLAELGKKHVMALENELVSIHPRQWPPEALAGNSLYRISKTILEYNQFGTVEELLQWIESTLADIMGACLTNLPYAIFVEYISGMVTERVKRVKNAVFILGKAQNLEDALHWSCFKEPDDENANVDRWRSGEADPFSSYHHDNCNTFAH